MLRALLIFSLALSLSGLSPGGAALGSVGKPAASLQAAPTASPPPPAPLPGHGRRVANYFTEIRDRILARFRPVERDRTIDFHEATQLLQRKTTQEKIFNADMSGKMKNEYFARVAPFEGRANDPVWRPRYWEVQRYEEGREGLARWTTREILDDQLKAFFHGGDKDSAPMKVLHTARELTGGGEEKPAEPRLSAEEKAARAHRRDLPPVADAEEKIPVKLRTKINVIRQNGSVVFTNPIAITSLNGNAEDLSFSMNREFKKLTLRSNMAYAVKQELFNVNVNKKITDQVSLDLDHYNYTGSRRGSSGEKTREQARVNYSVSF